MHFGQQMPVHRGELNERLIELIIGSTPSDGFQKELLGKDIDFSINEVLKEGRKFEAFTVGNDQIRKLDPEPVVTHEVSRSRECKTCGAHHGPRQYPAFNNTCHGCGAIGHWKKMCCKTKIKAKL